MPFPRTRHQSYSLLEVLHNLYLARLSLESSRRDPPRHLKTSTQMSNHVVWDNHIGGNKSDPSKNKSEHPEGILKTSRSDEGHLKEKHSYVNFALVPEEDSDTGETQRKTPESKKISIIQISSSPKTLSKTKTHSSLVNNTSSNDQRYVSTNSIKERPDSSTKTPSHKPDSKHLKNSISKDHSDSSINSSKSRFYLPHDDSPSVDDQGTHSNTYISEERTAFPSSCESKEKEDQEPSSPSPSDTPKREPVSRTNSSKQQTDNPDGMWLERFESVLRSCLVDQHHMTPEHIKDFLCVEDSFFADRLVQLAHDSLGGQISVDRLVATLRQYMHGSQTDKLRLLFDVYNIKGNEGIERNELQQFFTSVIQESNLSLETENIQGLIEMFFKTADKNNDGKISFEELQDIFQRRPSIIDNINIRPGRKLNLHREMKKTNCCSRRFSRTYIRNNLRKILSNAFCIIVTLALMAVGVYKSWDKDAWIKVARAHGAALNFNCTLVLVLMLRRTITWLRKTPLRNVLPFDHHISLHKLCGYFIAVLSLGHIIGHVGHCVKVHENGSSNLTVPEMLFTTRMGLGWVKHSAYITGDILVVILFVMVVLSLPIVRQSGYFEVFYWSHKLYMVFWVVLIIHAPDFWKWFVVPGAIFVLEMLSRNSWIRMFSMGKTYIERVSLLPSGVTHLVISRPNGFEFKPGDYIFIQVPSVAQYETHPFTISSAPENKEELWLHVRSAGVWTKSLYNFFLDYQPGDAESGRGGVSTSDSSCEFRSARSRRRRASSVSWLTRRSSTARKKCAAVRERTVTKKVKVLVHIDGPYGTPTRQIFEQEHAVLIGSGIGITPYASILQSIVSRYKACCVSCPSCTHVWVHQPPAFAMTLKKVDFVWINRDQRQFEWFLSMLGRLEREQDVEGGLKGIVDMHMFITSLPAKTDMRGMALELALGLFHEDDDTDLLTGLRTRTQGGRPDFDVLFQKIRDKSQGRKIKVFFCGSPLLGKTIKLFCSKYDFGFAHEYF